MAKNPRPTPVAASRRPRGSLALLALASLPAVALGACVEPSVYLPSTQSGSPKGALSGDLTYAGPLPCTESQHILGAAVLEIFDVKLLPPPEGLGTTAASLAAVGGDQLFGGVVDRLTFNKDGSLWCPPPGTPPITVSSSWGVAPLEGGVYEVRGFYDYDGNFDPTLSIAKVPTKGDIGGGAIDNAAAVLMGAAPVYRRIGLGAPQADGSFKIPPEGSLVGGVAVTLGLSLPLDIPVFNVTGVHYSPTACAGDPPLTGDAGSIHMPSDYTLPVFDPFAPDKTEPSLVRVVVSAGLPAAEQDAAVKPPFGLPVKPASPFNFTWQDVNGDGVLDLAADHVPDSTLIPSLFPLAIFAKLVDPDTTLYPDHIGDLAAQAAPVVILQGLTIYKDLQTTASTDWSTPQPDDPSLTVGLRPAVLCLDPTDQSKRAKLVVTHETDCVAPPSTHNVLTDELATTAALKKQFGHDVDVVYACLPEGRYAMNVIYGTGQAWTVPNEAGVCAELEKTQDNNKTCGVAPAIRPVLHSQDVWVTIEKPVHADYCQAHATPLECLPKDWCTKNPKYPLCK
jgi:hypothetical protein